MDIQIIDCPDFEGWSKRKSSFVGEVEYQNDGETVLVVPADGGEVVILHGGDLFLENFEPSPLEAIKMPFDAFEDWFLEKFSEQEMGI